MKDFNKIFKELAQSRQLTREHVVQRCILKAMQAGVWYEMPYNAELYAAQADYYIRKAFTPISRKVKLDNGREPHDTVYWTLYSLPRLNASTFFDTAEEASQYFLIQAELVKLYKKPSDYRDRHYFYVFVLQDISPEYQAVQACHAAAKMGHREGWKEGMDANKFDQLYITLIGVPDVAALNVAITDAKAVGAEIYEFREPDIGNELTAVATSPIRMGERKRLLSYKRLKFFSWEK